MRTRITRLVMVGILAALVGPAPVAAKDPLDIEGRRLQAAAERAAATPGGAGRVVETLAATFAVPESTVIALRDQERLGYGEIGIALALSRTLADRDGLAAGAALEQILGRRRAGEGWGQIANGLDLRLGEVVSGVRRADRSVARLEKPERPAAEGSRNRLEKPERPHRPFRAERVERFEGRGRR